jgi:hypothetical protein
LDSVTTSCGSVASRSRPSATATSTPAATSAIMTSQKRHSWRSAHRRRPATVKAPASE